jgi:predicted pyridoxine 5'-phosphate oxidase superfamily flavin-nucleotide-binding protein
MSIEPLNSDAEPSPFHRGEQAIQAKLGVRERSEKIGAIAIRDHLPEQHQKFYSQLPFVFIGALDQHRLPWASVLFGRPGFMHAPDSKTLEIRTQMIDGDPLAHQLEPGSAVGVLGIEYETRRRNRLTARIEEMDDRKIRLSIDQTFGNCPQYIQARGLSLLEQIDSVGDARESENLDRISGVISEFVAQADNFYIASHHTEQVAVASNGADVSHRGGKPGFVEVLDEQTLQFPDYPGNNHFNTFGNLALNPEAGLTFIDSSTGDILFLTGDTEIIWQGPEVERLVGAKRVVRFVLKHGRWVKAAVPIRWNFLNYSPRFAQIEDSQ